MSPIAGKLVGGEPWGQFDSGKMSHGGTHSSTFRGKKMYFNATWKDLKVVENMFDELNFLLQN